MMVLQGSVQKSAIPPVEAEFANFLANNNGMDPKAKQQRVQAAKHIIEENIPGMDRLLS
ncbi:MAG: hypothetical protein LBD11_03635 [Candidatus Peribacteria bacterium]|nr:hypothetical protein [Candidatus Peribacteria bacterium]